MSRTDSPRAHSRANPHSRHTPSVRREVSFSFEGKRLEGIAGESIARALFRNGIRTLSHSVKYGRPRGIHCGRGRCAMCQVEVDGVTGVKACITPLVEGMRIRRQNYKPFYGLLLTRIMSRVSFPAGFYYRMFTRPRWVRDAFIGTIRRMAGVGRVDDRVSRPHDLRPPDPARPAPQTRYDVVVVGAGISGMAAALGAAGAGADVLLVDDFGFLGGHTIGHVEDPGLAETRTDLIRQIEQHASITVRTETTAQGFYPPDRLMLGRGAADGYGGVLETVSARSLVFATGALDVIPLFENNDLPGVFGARGARVFLERDGLVFANSAVVYGTGPDVAQTVGLLRAHAIKVEAVVTATLDLAEGFPENIRYYAGARLARAEGREWISHVVFALPDGNEVSVSCEALCIAGPGQPAFELAQQAGFDFAFADQGTPEDLAVLTPTTDAIEGEPGSSRFLVGEASGRFDWKEKIEHAAAVGVAARRAAGL